MVRPLHIACLQTRPMPTIAAAIEEAVPMIQDAASAGAQIVFLPEYCGGLRSDGARLCPPAEAEADHPFLAKVREAAAEKGLWINIGSIAVKGPGGKIINRGFMIDDKGTVTGRYDKIHLFDVRLSESAVYRESETVEPGSSASVYETPFARIGQTICYDLRFPGLYRDLAKAGAEVLCCPAAFTKTTGQVHWHALNRARAIENTRFMVSACAVGEIEGGGESYGHSLVVGPWGDVLADGSDLPGVIHAQLDLDLVEATAGRIPSLGHDRAYTVGASVERDVA